MAHHGVDPEDDVTWAEGFGVTWFENFLCQEDHDESYESDGRFEFFQGFYARD